MDKYANVSEKYGKDEKLKREDVENLMSWEDKQPHLPKISELQGVLFLHSCYFSVEQAKRAIEIFFTMRTMFKELFKNGDVNDPAIQTALSVAIIYILPKCDPNGHKIVFMRLLDTNIEKYTFVDHLRMFDMMITLHMHLEGTNEGVNLVFDLQGVSFSHLLRLSPVFAHKYVYYLQEALPIRLKRIYLTNSPSWIDKGLAFFKPFLKKELYDSIRVFTDIESLFKIIPREIFPADYGGRDVDHMGALAEKNRRMFEECSDFFEAQEAQLTDESRRVEKSRDFDNVFGVEGTFRKLQLD